jgi:hypothetical protein
VIVDTSDEEKTRSESGSFVPDHGRPESYSGGALASAPPSTTLEDERQGEPEVEPLPGMVYYDADDPVERAKNRAYAERMQKALRELNR